MTASRWDLLIKDHLLKDGIITGVSIISRNATCVYSLGKLQQLDQACISRLSQLFTRTSSQEEAKLCQRGLTLTSHSTPESVTFHIFRKTNSSIYGTAASTGQGLLVGLTPHGLLVCTYSPAGAASRAAQYFEGFCHLLRR